jgi:arylsulfatase A-like enzyme
VFILADDLGINDLACYGRREHRTPHLDRLAAQGARFTAAYCAQPICSPSRAAILTGKTPARLHLTTYLPGRSDCPSQKLQHPRIRMELPLEEKTLAEHLKAAGYATACIGKWHLGGQGFGPREQGYDFYHAGQAITQPSETEGGKGEYDLTRQAMEFIQAQRDRPFFLYLAHNTPHIPYAARTNLVEKNQSSLEPVYAAVIETMDDGVGLLLTKLDELGLAANTIVIFTSDNGGLHVPEGRHRVITHNAPFRAGKGFLHEGGLRIPLLVRWPGRVPAGRTVDTPVLNTDWLPTLLELAGRPVPEGLDGVSFASPLTGQGKPPARRLFWHFPHYTNQGSQPAGAVRDGDWKYIEYYENNRAELFNLARDPGETDDLAASESGRVRQLHSQLEAWRVSAGAQTNTPNPDFNPALHRALYVDVDVSRYNAATADMALRERVLAWRKQMNAALPISGAKPRAKPRPER